MIVRAFQELFHLRLHLDEELVEARARRPGLPMAASGAPTSVMASRKGFSPGG